MSVKCDFSNLFSKLSALDEDVRTPDGSGFTLSNQTENHGARGRKRKSQAEQHGTNLKKRCYRSQNAFRDSPAQWHQNQRDYSAAGRAEGTRTNHRSKPDNNKKQSCGGQNYRPNWNVKKKTQSKRTEQDKQTYRNRRGGRRDGTNQDKKKFMTQEFKDQNVLMVDGKLLCRHFLYGRCIKKDACQLLHIQGYNDLIKEACKFYIQGFCMKGESCIFMHKSFPCKFFHRRGKCSQEENCRFSHVPLNDVTEKLLDKQEKIRYEVTKEGEEEKTETNKNPDLLTEAPRSGFYNSTDAEKETNPHQTEVSVSDSAEPHSSTSDDQNHLEPVCYSVEAVLGPQLSRTFSSFSKSQKSESVSFSNQNEVPYSVDAVLRSCKQVEKSSNFGPSSSTMFCNPRMVSETVGDPQNQTLPEKSKTIKNSSQENLFQSCLSSGANTDAASDVPHRSEGLKVRAAGRSSQEDELDLCPSVSEAEKSSTCRTEEPKLLTDPPSSESSTKQPGLPEYPNRSDLRFLSKPSCPSSGVSESKERVSAPVEPGTTSGNKNVAANIGVHRFAFKQLPDILQNSKKKQLVVKPAASEIQTSWSKTSDQVGPNETQKGLFAERVTPAGSTGSIKPEQSAGGKVNSSCFFSLFATPLGSSDQSFQSTSRSAPPPCSQPSAEKPEPAGSGLQPISTGLRAESPAASQSPLKENAAVTPGSSRSDDSGEQQPPDISSPRETSSDSVLKTLFLKLKAYQEDGGPQGCSQNFIPSDGEKDKRTEEQQLKKSKRKKTQKNDLREKTTDDLRPAARSRTEAPGRLKVTRPGTTEPRATHSFPCKSATRLERPEVKPVSTDGAEVNRNTAPPLRDLFKSLDAAVFHKR